MKNNLKKLFEGFSYSLLSGSNNPILEINKVTNDSRQISKTSIFVAIKGTSSDGHDYLSDVCVLAPIVVVEDSSKLPANYKGRVYKVKSSKTALAHLAKNMYSPDIDHLNFYGVTGTNGKTSTTYIIENLLKHLGQVNAVLGTNNHRVGDKVWKSQLTTPGALELHRRLEDMQKEGADSVSMEVSSHALVQKRVDSLKFNSAIFTNLSQDHLDYHKDMDTYFRAKELMFTKYLAEDGCSVINGDDEFGLKMKPSHGSIYYYGKMDNNDFRFNVFEELFNGTKIELRYKNDVYNFQSPLIGEHNVYNLVAAIIAVWSLGQSLDKIIDAVSSLSTIPGRLDSVANTKGLNIYVDYAHTPDALEKVLIVLKNIRKQMNLQSKIIVVFGCGGDRDKSKRPLMFSAAKNNSDICVVTSDNPRTEKPEAIIEGIVENSLESESLIIEIDRKAAISRALSLCVSGDIVLVAGKGHEDYQVLGTKKVYFSDYEVLKEALDVI